MNKGDLIFEVKIHNFIERILISKERRTKYYQKGCELKKKYQNKQFYRFKKVKVGNREQVYLVDIRTGLPVISNPRTAGTPKYLKIKGIVNKMNMSCLSEVPSIEDREDE